jgi:hypothetical protein
VCREAWERLELRYARWERLLASYLSLSLVWNSEMESCAHIRIAAYVLRPGITGDLVPTNFIHPAKPKSPPASIGTMATRISAQHGLDSVL